MSSAPVRPPSAAPGPRPASAPASPAASKLNVAIDPLKLLRQNWLWLGIAGVLGVVLGVGTHYTLLFFAPRFAALAYFEVKGQIREAGEITTSVGISEDELERYIQTQVERMQSDDILRQVANSPRIRRDTKWSNNFLSASGQYDPVEAYLELKEIVSVRSIPETNYIVLSVTTGTKDDSQTIASVVTGAYQEAVNRDSNQGQLDIQQSLTNQLNAIQEERLLLDDRMKRLLRDNNLTTLDEKLTSERMVIANVLPTLQETRYGLSNLREQLAINEEQLNAPGGANYPELIRTAVNEDPIILSFERRIADLKASLRGARENFGPNHRSVKQLERTIDAVENEMAAQEQELLEKRFISYIETLRTQIRQLSTVEAESVARLEEAEARQSELQAVLEDYNKLGADLDRLAQRETELESRIAEARAIQDRAASRRVQLVQPARAEDRPVFPQLIIVAPGVTVLVVGFVGGLIFLRELLEQRVRGPADLSLISRLRIAGVIPDLSEDPSNPPAMETVVLDRPDGVITESIRNTRTEILKRFGRSGAKTLLVAGGMPRSGSTSFAVNLARSCASCELKTLLIDANLRRPGVHAAVGVPESPGLGEVLGGKSTLADSTREGDTPGLYVLSAGAPGERAPERLITQAFQRTLEEAAEAYDIVIIDSSPAIVSSDAFTIAARVDASLLVIRAYAETRGLVTRLRGKLDEASSEFMGVIVNGVRSAAGGYFKKNYLETHRYIASDAPRGPGAKNDGGGPGKKRRKKDGRKKDEKGKGAAVVADDSPGADAERGGDGSPGADGRPTDQGGAL